MSCLLRRCLALGFLGAVLLSRTTQAQAPAPIPPSSNDATTLVVLLEPRQAPVAKRLFDELRSSGYRPRFADEPHGDDGHPDGAIAHVVFGTQRVALSLRNVKTGVLREDVLNLQGTETADDEIVLFVLERLRAHLLQYGLRPAAPYGGAAIPCREGCDPKSTARSPAEARAEASSKMPAHPSAETAGSPARPQTSAPPGRSTHRSGASAKDAARVGIANAVANPRTGNAAIANPRTGNAAIANPRPGNTAIADAGAGDAPGAKTATARPPETVDGSVEMTSKSKGGAAESQLPSANASQGRSSPFSTNVLFADLGARVLPSQQGLDSITLVAIGAELRNRQGWGVRADLAASVDPGRVSSEEGHAELSILTMEAAGGYTAKLGWFAAGVDAGLLVARGTGTGHGSDGFADAHAESWNLGPFARPRIEAPLGPVRLRLETALGCLLPEAKIRFAEREVARWGAAIWWLGVSVGTPVLAF